MMELSSTTIFHPPTMQCANSLSEFYLPPWGRIPTGSMSSIFALFVFVLAAQGTPAEENAENNARLISAAVRNDLNGVKQALTAGADMNARSGAGATALMILTHHENLDGVRFLAERGADVNAQDSIGYRAVTLAAIEKPNPDLLRYLISKGARVDALWKQERTLLMQAVARAGVAELMADQKPWQKLVEVIRILVNSNVPVNARDTGGIYGGYTALMYAASHERPDIAAMLLAKGADVNAAAENGETALSLARKSESKAVEKLLLAAGARTRDP